MKNILKDKGIGFYVGCVSAVAAIVSIVGCLMLGGMPFVIALLVAGILLFAVASTKNVSLLVFPSYFCYLAAGALFLANQLYTITNVIAAIDTTSFETPFVVAGAAIIVTIVTGLISTIPVQHK
ncbi:MAG: hypothetical protein KH902_03930 [Subdoligranulum variabile]|nr:hypothetical protein [Subdoligranulum variabile]